ncbi:MAG: DUF4352 domain-containing protein [Lachnospiraceae bacterium]|nr:DUF4352 domain-containing protein [Lachnospiraceae bacterium]
MLVKMICPRCGASLEIDDAESMMTCKYCGYQQANLTEKVEVTHKVDRSNEPNLCITYNTINPNVQMVTRIVSTGQKNTYVNGQTMTFHLPAGPQEVILKIGKKNYSRNIVIPEDNQPVRISASFSGRANIGVDQPTYQVTAPDGTVRNVTGEVPKKKQSVFGIIGFILSLTMYLSPVGLALGIVDTIRAKKNPDHAHGLAKAAIVIGGILTIVLFVTISSCNKSAGTSSDTKSTTAAVQKTAEAEKDTKDAAKDVKDDIEDIKEDLESAKEELGSIGDEFAEAIGLGGDKDEEEGAVKETTPEETTTEAPKDNRFKIGEEFGNRTIKGAVLSADLDYKDYGDFTTVDEGYKAVYIRILMTNVSNSTNYVSVGDFSCYVDNVITDADMFGTGDEDYNANIAPGRSTILGAMYIVPEDEKTIELEYNPIGEFSRRQIIVVQDGSETSTRMVDDRAIEDAKNVSVSEDVDIIGIGEEFGNKTINGVVMDADLDYKGYNEFWTTIPEGYKAIYLKIKVTNISKDSNYVSVGDFSCYADNFDVDAELVSGGNEDYNANIDPDRAAVLGAMYVIPKDTKSIELEYDPLGEYAKRVIIKIQ